MFFVDLLLMLINLPTVKKDNKHNIIHSDNKKISSLKFKLNLLLLNKSIQYLPFNIIFMSLIDLNITSQSGSQSGSLSGSLCCFIYCSVHSSLSLYYLSTIM